MILLTPFHFQSDRTYRARLTCDVALDLQMGYRGYHEFCHEGSLWGILTDDHLTILAGYASDLCSPGFCLFGRWYGTPSKGAELSSFVHDFARQFMRPNVECSPWDRKGSDDLFYNAMTMQGFPHRDIYHGAVAGTLGKIWTSLNRPRPDVYCRCRHAKSASQQALEKWARFQKEPTP